MAVASAKNDPRLTASVDGKGGGKTSMDWYQHNRGIRTVVIFGDMAGDQLRHTERILYDADAYQAAQGYEYLKELIELRSPQRRAIWVDFGCLAGMLVQFKAAEFCELGSTLLASIDKIKIAAAISSLALNLDAVDFIGVELSPYFRDVAAMVARQPIRQFASYADVPLPAKPRVFYSHFVGGYAFNSAAAMAAWLKPAEAFLISESFSIGGGDIETSVLGKRATHFDFTTLFDSLTAAGFQVAPYHFRRVDLRGIPAIQVHIVAGKSSVTMPHRIVAAAGFNASTLANIPTREEVMDHFRRAVTQEVEPPGASGFR